MEAQSYYQEDADGPPTGRSRAFVALEDLYSAWGKPERAAESRVAEPSSDSTDHTDATSTGMPGTKDSIDSTTSTIGASKATSSTSSAKDGQR